MRLKSILTTTLWSTLVLSLLPALASGANGRIVSSHLDKEHVIVIVEHPSLCLRESRIKTRSQKPFKYQMIYIGTKLCPEKEKKVK